MRDTAISLLTYFIITTSSYAPVNASVGKHNVKLKEIPLDIKSKDIRISKRSKIKSTVNKVKTYDYNGFLYELGKFESGNDYKKVNTLGYLGRYQFGKSTLKTIKINTTSEEFLNNPNLQETAMWRLLKHNQRSLKKYIELWDGKYHNGKLITESGILAAAHLAGQGNVKKFFKRGKNPKDAYGTPLSKYLYTFSGYDLKLK